MFLDVAKTAYLSLIIEYHVSRCLPMFARVVVKLSSKVRRQRHSISKNYLPPPLTFVRHRFVYSCSLHTHLNLLDSKTPLYMRRDVFYTLREAARILGVSSEHVQGMLEEDNFQGKREAGQWRVLAYTVHHWLPQNPPNSTTRTPESI